MSFQFRYSDTPDFQNALKGFSTISQLFFTSVDVKYLLQQAQVLVWILYGFCSLEKGLGYNQVFTGSWKPNSWVSFFSKKDRNLGLIIGVKQTSEPNQHFQMIKWCKWILNLIESQLCVQVVASNRTTFLLQWRTPCTPHGMHSQLITFSKTWQFTD